MKLIVYQILIKATGDYHASFVEIMLTHYIRIQNTYAEISENEKDMVKQINSALDSKTEIEMTSELDIFTGLYLPLKSKE